MRRAMAGAAAAEEGQSVLPVGCRGAHLREVGQRDCWSAMASIGAECVEAAITEDLLLPELVHPEHKYSVASDAGIERVAADAKAAGRRITALCMNNRFDERPEYEVEWCTKAANVAHGLGAKAIRINVWPHKLAVGEFLQLAIRTLGKVIAATESTGVAFAIENHGSTTNNPQFLQSLFDGVGSKRLGLTLDTGNFYWFGYPLSRLYTLYETFAPRVFHTHCKNIGYPESEREKQRPMGWEYEKYHGPLDRGDIDFQRVIAILRKAGYANDLCIEDESLGRVPAARGARFSRGKSPF